MFSTPAYMTTPSQLDWEYSSKTPTRMLTVIIFFRRPYSEEVIVVIIVGDQSLVHNTIAQSKVGERIEKRRKGDSTQ